MEEQKRPKKLQIKKIYAWTFEPCGVDVRLLVGA